MLNELGNIIWNHEWERQCEERDILREKNENATSEEYTINSWLLLIAMVTHYIFNF
jgi:hypothetical protein